MMRKGTVGVVIAAIACVFASVNYSGAQSSSGPPLTLRVKAVNGTQAVLTDINTGVQTTVQVNDVIQGWAVATITPSAVELEREDPEQGKRIRAQLPVGVGGLSGSSPVP